MQFMQMCNICAAMQVNVHVPIKLRASSNLRSWELIYFFFNIHGFVQPQKTFCLSLFFELSRYTEKKYVNWLRAYKCFQGMR